MVENRTNKVLAAILFVLVAIAAILLACIIYIYIQKQENYNNEEDQVIGTIVEEIATISEEDAIILIDNETEKYAGTPLEFEIKMVKVNMLYNANDYKSALLAAKDIKEEVLNDEEKMDYYSILRLIYLGLNDEEISRHYGELFMKLYLENSNSGIEDVNDN